MDQKRQVRVDERVFSKEKILAEVKRIYRETYDTEDVRLVQKVFDDISRLFAGTMPGYLPCDTSYHDLKHTLQVIEPFIGIIDGINNSEHFVNISKDLFDIGITAVLLHDTGYIKAEDDTEGTGGKYTFSHIERSIDFAVHYLSGIGFRRDHITSVKNIIMCTGVIVDYHSLPFNSEEERSLGYALGTADLLGQMSASDYIEKLPFLYREFEESYHFEGIEKLRKKNVRTFTSADDLIRSTPQFYDVVARKRFQEMGNLYLFLQHHSGEFQNPYIEAIEHNINTIREIYPTQ